MDEVGKPLGETPQMNSIRSGEAVRKLENSIDEPDAKSGNHRQFYYRLATLISKSRRDSSSKIVLCERSARLYGLGLNARVLK